MKPGEVYKREVRETLSLAGVIETCMGLPIDGDLKGYLSGRSTLTFQTPPSYGAGRKITQCREDTPIINVKEVESCYIYILIISVRVHVHALNLIIEFRVAGHKSSEGSMYCRLLHGQYDTKPQYFHDYLRCN